MSDDWDGVNTYNDMLADIRKAVAAERERCAKLVPTTWLDPLLSGDGVRNLPWGCPEIEALLRSVRDRILGASQ